ncbi:hypothetical protein [Streptomyces sp. NPDC059788]|uniref:hypothetical protein n=1 Tax=Streptomyces sp. NPDC059788 TaxID=3346948 RepID=UPI00364B61F3
MNTAQRASTPSVRAVGWVELGYSVVWHATIRIGFTDQMMFSFNASSGSAALIERFAIPGSESASPIRLVVLVALPATSPT